MARPPAVLKSWFQSFFGQIPEDDVLAILTPIHHGTPLRNERSAILLNRGRFVALVFAIVTPAWIAVDAWSFGWPIWGWLALDRIAASALFLLISAYASRRARPQSAFAVVAAVFAVPILFFLASGIVLPAFPESELPLAVNTAYSFLPFIIAVGLSLFPLTAVENAAIALPLLISLAVIGPENELAGTVYDLGVLWELAVITAVASFAGMTQLAFLTRFIDKASRDALTGLFSRRFAEQVFEIQFEVAKRNDGHLAVLFIDLDRFKTVNDQFGHDAGDEVLATAGLKIRTVLRQQDIAARWGGEEFLVVLPNTDLAGTDAVIDRLRKTGLGRRPDGAAQTASIGIAERKRDHMPDVRSLADAADRRLYQAKDSGRNCMVGPDGIFVGLFRPRDAKG